MTDATVEDYVRGWVDTYHTPAMPVGRDDLITLLISAVPFSREDPCTSLKREILTEFLETPKTPARGVVRPLLEKSVDEQFADLLTPYLARRVVDLCGTIEGPSDPIPWGMKLVLREAMKEEINAGALEEEVELYRDGKLADRLE
ncbi:hypothetical protein [Salinibacter ruber]|uniref:Uncharacterized protein n=1 Tax=Salinibacter ruber TaxID=146919 RepID=A0AAW5PC02_9BACT|nr:hypothetical protein [Salinibacter ruber]MCS4159472.1 hypothetical protein [Salinibacter ruber]